MNPWKLFKSSELFLAVELVRKISDTLSKFNSLDLNSMTDGEKNILLTLSDNNVPYEWRKLWQGPKFASEFLKAVAVRAQTVSKFLENLDGEIQEIDFSKIFNVDSFLSTIKLVTSRELKVSTSDLILESFTDIAKYEKLKTEKIFVVTAAPLLIDGMSFEKNRLIQSDGSNTNNLTSSIFLFFREQKNVSANDDSKSYAVPLYATHSREKLLCTIKLSTSLSKDEIIYSGTSLIVPGN